MDIFSVLFEKEITKVLIALSIFIALIILKKIYNILKKK